MDGLDVMAALSNRRCDIPVIFMSGHCEFSMCVRAMKAGAIDFLLKPLRKDDLVAAVTSAHLASINRRMARDESQRAADLLRRLTVRERQVLALVLDGRRNKQIAAELDSQEATIKVHRSRLMRKLGVRSLPDVVRISDRGDLAAMLRDDREVAEPHAQGSTIDDFAGPALPQAGRGQGGDGWLAAEGNWHAFTWRAPS
jgi:FixJ family two-component response regulator